MKGVTAKNKKDLFDCSYAWLEDLYKLEPATALFLLLAGKNSATIKYNTSYKIIN